MEADHINAISDVALFKIIISDLWIKILDFFWILGPCLFDLLTVTFQGHFLQFMTTKEPFIIQK